MADQTWQENKKNVEKIWKEVEMNSQRFAGVLAEDPNACYVALLQRLHNENLNLDKVQLNAFAITIVKAKAIFLYRMGVYSDSNTPDRLLAHLKETVAALYAANN